MCKGNTDMIITDEDRREGHGLQGRFRDFTCLPMWTVNQGPETI